MWRRNLGNTILASIICAAVLYLIIPFDFMLKDKPQPPTSVYHEEPEIAKPVSGGIPIFMFDPDYLRFLSQMDIEEVKAMLVEKPFLRNPQTLKEVIDKFTESNTYMSNMVSGVNEKLDGLRTLTGESQSDRNTRLMKEISARLKQAGLELRQIEDAAQTTGGRFKIFSTPTGSTLRMSYEELQERIAKEREMLDLEEAILANFSRTLAGELLNMTQVTLEAGPITAFVGDNIRFQGVLTSEGNPLDGQEVNISLNSSTYITIKTDAYGRYQGTLQVPYWCLPELDLQALYCPRDIDIDVYSASWSPVMKVKVQSYEASLEVDVEDKAYPGMETTVNARFKYAQPSPADERKVEIYFDDVLINEVMAREAFAQKIKIDPQTAVGKHVITVSSAAVGRYSPVVASARISVTGVTPILDLSIPGVAIIPGSLGLEGKLYSGVSPLSGASIKMRLGKSQVELASSEDGAFATRIKIGMGFSVIGSQDLEIQVLPKEPWNAPLKTTRSILVVNVVNCGVLIVVILLLGIYLPVKLRRRPGAYLGRTARPEMVTALPEPSPAYSERVAVPAAIEEGGEASAEPRNSIFYWYRLVVKLLGGTTRALLKPQQTLREFARESSRVIGPAAKFFMELTRMVERLLYSPYRPTEQDAENSRQLARKIKKKAKTAISEAAEDETV